MNKTSEQAGQEYTFVAVKKFMAINYRKRTGAEYTDFFLEDKDGYVKSVSPRQFEHINLPDESTEYVINKHYSNLVAKIRNSENFGSFLDRTKKAQKLGINWTNQPKEFYLNCCN